MLQIKEGIEVRVFYFINNGLEKSRIDERVTRSFEMARKPHEFSKQTRVKLVPTNKFETSDLKSRHVNSYIIYNL